MALLDICRESGLTYHGDIANVETADVDIAVIPDDDAGGESVDRNAATR